MTKTRAEHIQWCKARALAELDGRPDATERAIESMTSDLRKHPSTAADAAQGLTGVAPIGVELAYLEIMSGTGMRTEAEVRRWIQGF